MLHYELGKNGKKEFFSTTHTLETPRGHVFAAPRYPQRFVSSDGCPGRFIYDGRCWVVWNYHTAVGGFRELVKKSFLPLFYQRRGGGQHRERWPGHPPPPQLSLTHQESGINTNPRGGGGFRTTPARISDQTLGAGKKW